MRWRNKKDRRDQRGDVPISHEDKLMSRMRSLHPVKFKGSAEDVEARIRRMSYGAKLEHRPSWMAVDDWENRDTA